MFDKGLDRAQILMQQQRYAEAEKVLADLITQDPNDVYILSLLSEVHLQQDKISTAETLINAAIGISPETSHLFYIKARILIQKDFYDEAENNLHQALQIDPDDADYFSLLASIKLTKKEYDEALELANKSLELDAENLLGLNMRSTALLKLNRHEDSFETIEGALREDPNNAYTHSNYGWNLLEKGNHNKALEHFREALKSDPSSSYAQSGMVEALKAKNIIYRWFLKYSFWMGNLTEKYQWGVIIGFYVGFRVLRSVANTNESLRPYLTPLIVLLAIFAFSTWVINPISNLFLRLNRYGKHLLDKKEMMSSNFVGISFLIFLLGGIAYFITKDTSFLAITVFGFAMMLPFSVMFSPTKYKNSLLVYASIMTLIGIGAITKTFMTGELFNGFAMIFIFGFIAYQWIANFLIIRQSNY